MWQFNLTGRKFRNEAGDGSEGVGAGADTTNDNNSDSNLQSYDDLWKVDDEDENSGNQQNKGTQTANKGADANAAFQQHIDGLDFTSGVDVNAAMSAMQSGDVEGFTKALEQVGANAYRNAIVDANKVVQQRVDQMATNVKNDVAASNASSEVVREMNTQLPFTKSPAFAPVAKLVLTQFLESGKSSQDAITETGKYFQNLSTETQKLSPNAPGGRPAGGFGGTNSGNNAGNDDAEPDWVEMLGGPAQ